MAHDSIKTLNGIFGKVYHEGKHLMNVYGLELNIEIEYHDVNRSGTRWVGKKAGTITADGTIQSYHVNNDFTDAISQILDDSKGAFVTELHAQIDDPENPEMSGMYRIKGVQFTTVPVLNFTYNQLVEQELQFIFQGYERIS